MKSAHAKSSSRSGINASKLSKTKKNQSKSNVTTPKRKPKQTMASKSPRIGKKSKKPIAVTTKKSDDLKRLSKRESERKRNSNEQSFILPANDNLINDIDSSIDTILQIKHTILQQNELLMQYCDSTIEKLEQYGSRPDDRYKKATLEIENEVTCIEIEFDGVNVGGIQGSRTDSILDALDDSEFDDILYEIDMKSDDTDASDFRYNIDKNDIDPISKAMQSLNRNILFLDGGLGTHLSELGANVKGDLWASKVLVTNPELIKSAHLNYLNSGANIITSASYQASFEAFNKMYKYDEYESGNKMRESVNLCYESIEFHKQHDPNKQKKSISVKGFDSSSCIASDVNVAMKEPKLIAASMGAYGAHLCDGCEYRGYAEHKDVNESVIAAFHIKKMKAIMNDMSVSSVEDNLYNYNRDEIIFACETVPCIMEMKVLCQILNGYKYFGWISMSIMNDKQLNSGELIGDAVDMLMKYNINKDGKNDKKTNGKGYVLGIGINCSLPRYVSNAIKLIKHKKKWDGHIIIYPNNGKEYSTEIGGYLENGAEWDNNKYAKYAKKWYNLGASVIGGCCLTNPNTVQCVRHKILESIK